MLKDHKEMNRQLKEIADKVKVKLPDDLTAEQKDVLAKLKDASDADFDRMYMDTMVADHKKAIAAFGSWVRCSYQTKLPFTALAMRDLLAVEAAQDAPVSPRVQRSPKAVTRDRTQT